MSPFQGPGTSKQQWRKVDSATVPGTRGDHKNLSDASLVLSWRRLGVSSRGCTSRLYCSTPQHREGGGASPEAQDSPGTNALLGTVHSTPRLRGGSAGKVSPEPCGTGSSASRAHVRCRAHQPTSHRQGLPEPGCQRLLRTRPAAALCSRLRRGHPQPLPSPWHLSAFDRHTTHSQDAVKPPSTPPAKTRFTARQVPRTPREF